MTRDPGSQRQIVEQIEFLAGYGIGRSSILIVPDFHHDGIVAGDPAFCAAVSQWQAAGHELVLHGYFHDRRESPPEKLSTLFWTRLYTSREAEFLDLPPDTARQRLENGRALFTTQGWRAKGFVAPAWLMAKGLTDLLATLEFTYTTRLGEIVPLRYGRPGHRLAIALLQHALGLAPAGLRRLEQTSLRPPARDEPRAAQPASARS